MNEYVKSDLYRYTGRTDSRAFWGMYRHNRTFRWQVAFRLAKTGSIWGKVLWKLNRMKHEIDIPLETQVGYGLYIGHGGPIICNPTAVIGNNVNLSQWTTIGSNGGGAAIIGDNVYIGPSCCLVERVKVGDNVTLGAGSIVTKDIPDNATAAGNYAKVLNYNNPGRYIVNPWEVN